MPSRPLKIQKNLFSYCKFPARHGDKENLLNICGLDFDAYTARGIHLQRTQTLAGGANHCDFRISRLPPEWNPLPSLFPRQPFGSGYTAPSSCSPIATYWQDAATRISPCQMGLWNFIAGKDWITAPTVYAPPPSRISAITSARNRVKQ